MRQKTSMWIIIKEKIARNILLALVSIGGIILVTIDLAKNFMPKEVSLIVTFATTLVSFITFLLPILEYYFANFARSVDLEERKELIDYYKGEEKHASKGVAVNSETAPQDLLYVAANCMHKCPPMQVDGNSDCQTEYYIHSLSASHVDLYLEIMSKYLSAIVQDIIKKKCDNSNSNNKQCFFLIVPHGRNVLLANEVSKQINIPFLVSNIGKRSLDTGGTVNVNEDVFENFYKSFSGVDSFFEYITDQIYAEDSDIELNGIIVDDNTSRGSAFTCIAKYFNETLNKDGRDKLSSLFKNHCNQRAVKKHKIIINPITECAVLFLAFSNYKYGCFEALNKQSLSLKYFFELDENAKKEIYEHRDSFKPSSEPQDKTTLYSASQKCGFIKYDQKNNISESIILLKGASKK